MSSGLKHCVLSWDQVRNAGSLRWCHVAPEDAINHFDVAVASLGWGIRSAHRLASKMGQSGRRWMGKRGGQGVGLFDFGVVGVDGNPGVLVLWYHSRDSVEQNSTS